MNFNCPICSIEFHLKPYHVKRYKGPFCCSRKCRGQLIQDTYIGKNNPNYKYINEAQKFFAGKTSDIKKRCLDKNINYNLTQNFLYELYEKQQGLCYYTNIPMKLTTDNFKLKGQADIDVLSVDKVIPEKGYIKDNIVLCCSGINKLKGNSSLEEVEFFLKNIANKYKDKNES